jgi:hypothetical protein
MSAGTIQIRYGHLNFHRSFILLNLLFSYPATGCDGGCGFYATV